MYLADKNVYPTMRPVAGGGRFPTMCGFKRDVRLRTPLVALDRTADGLLGCQPVLRNHLGGHDLRRF
jgi:hypothetical protein